MGWRYRRSKTIGPFRVNASKRGVGESFGASGMRIGRSPSGKTWVSLGLLGTGLSYFRYLGRKRRR
ncbi:MAG: hypothetical protein QOI47_1030 [Actinomycetota bacterium]|nr:hypothetical protein [Actinomycetota bacterium]